MCGLEKNVFISSNHKCCIEGGLLNFNYKRNLTSRITLAFFPSLVAFVLQAQSPCRTRSRGTKVASQLGNVSRTAIDVRN